MRRMFCFVSLALIVLSTATWAQPGRCEKVGGVLMTNINAIAGETNLGPVFGDLEGSVAATILGPDGPNFKVQHYWVTSSGDTIRFNVAILKPSLVNSDPSKVAVLWGNYRSDILGGTGKFEGATGYLDYFGIADFSAQYGDPKLDDGSRSQTLVLRYTGQVCYANVKK